MMFNTIDNDRTMSGSAGTLLADRYRIVMQLGQGGMGSVWLAEDTQLDNKPFAIKMLPTILVSNKRAYRQLKDEALVAMKLVHPNIVQIRAFEENNGNPFLVMDYIDGQTLDDYLAEVGNGEQETGNGRARSPSAPQSTYIPEADVVRILSPIAAALDYAHSKGVVHRDVKPGNVMIAKDGTPYILDFGIAREIQETMTRVTGKLSSGTLLYMSPEQLRGQPPKAAQDVYSLAAMAYECLKGEPPFSRGQIEYQILNEQPERLSDDIRMSASIMRGLSKEPENRPDSCAKVLFTACQIRQMPSARPQAGVQPRSTAPIIDRIVVHPKRNIVGIVAPLICLVAALLVLVGVLWHREAQRQENAQKQAVEQEELRRRQSEDERNAQDESSRKKAKAERLAKQQQEEAQRKAEEEASRLQQEEMAGEIESSVPGTAKAQEENLVEQRRALQEFAVARRRMEEERLSKETRKQQILEAVRISAINVSPSGVLSVGFVDSSQRPEVRYYMQVGESRDGWLVKSADIVARTVMLKKDGVEVMLTLGSKPCAPIQNSRVEGKDGEKVNQLEEQTNGNVIQTLLGGWSCSTTLSGSNWTSAMKYEYNFKTDGGYTSILIGEVVIGKGGKTTIEERGTWSLSGNRLTLRATGRSVNDGTFNSAIVNVYKYDLLWRNDGAFELRFAEVERTLVDGSISIIQYDAEGREIKRTKGKGNEYRSVETAKLFRRVPN